jgi:hypothetical protein
MVDALKRVLLRESQIQPLLLVFKDVHWIDTETHTLLHSLVESLPTARLHLLVNYRCQEVGYLIFPFAFNSKLGVVISGAQKMRKYSLEHGPFVNYGIVVADEESKGYRLARGEKFAD